VVGLTRGAVDPAGNPVVYRSLPGAQEVLYQQDSHASVAARAANAKRLERAGYGPAEAAKRAPLLSGSTATVNAVLVKIEPTAALDTERGMKVMALLRRVAREKRSAVIAVTHDERMIEGFDSVYRMHDGRLARSR